jgi:hypothetical protein
MRLAGHPDKEQPYVDHAAEEARHGGGDQPVRATTGLQQEGEPGNPELALDVFAGRVDCQMTTLNPVTEITSPARLIQSPTVIFIGS